MAGARGRTLRVALRLGRLCRLSRLCAAMLLASLLAGTPDALAQQAARPRPLAQSLPPDAKRDYDAGKLLFEDGDYATALLMYQAAYNRTHDPRLLWNFAACQKDLRHYAKAGALLSRYVAEGGDLLSASDRRDAQELARAIAPFTALTTLRVSPDGAEVSVDDEPIGMSPLPGAVPLDIGNRRIRVRKDGFRLFERGFPVGGSAASVIDIALERQGGHLALSVPADATVRVDDKEVGHGPHVELDLPVGAHGLRVSAPRRRPLQSDVVIEDGKSRAMDVALDPDAEPRAEVRVAVRCGGSRILPYSSLAVFFDDATESAIPIGDRLRRQREGESIANVPYAVRPGRHAVHVSADGCGAADTTVDVGEAGIAEVKGMLPPEHPWLDSSPAGSPDGWRLAAGVIESSTTFTSYQTFFANSGTSSALSSIGPIPMTLVGPVFTAGLQGRWLLAMVDGRLQGGSTSGTSSGSGKSIAYDSSLWQWSLGARPGVRLPLDVVALSGGVGLHVGQYFFSPRASDSAQSGAYFTASLWAGLDVQPSCDWGGQLGVSTSADSYSVSGTVGNGAPTSVWAQVSYTPNIVCTRARAGLFRIVGTTLR